MHNIAEFHIIGRIGKIDRANDITHTSVAANYNRRDGDEWKTDPHWNRVTLFSKLRDRLARRTPATSFGLPDGCGSRATRPRPATPSIYSLTASPFSPRRTASHR